jgi:preprotein translocase subunit SecG
MYTFLVAIEIIVSILLIVVILMQNSKGGGLAGSLGGGNFGTVFGVRRTADFLTRATTILATTFIVLALLINIFFLPGKGTSSKESVIQSGQATVPPAQLPPQTQPSPANSPQK